VLALGIVLSIQALLMAQGAPDARREITLTAQDVPLSLADPTLMKVGRLRFLGGLALASADPDFGGLSGLMILADDQRLVGVTDQGHKFTCRLIFEGDRLRGVADASLEPLLDGLGKPLSGKAWSDAESVTRLAAGSVLVGFERNHRVLMYGPGLSGPARNFETPKGLAKAPSNGGLESLAAWPDGRLIALTEQMKTAGGRLQAFLLKWGTWSQLEWTPSEKGFEPSDATVLPDGDLVVLERYWSARNPLKLSSRLLRVKGDSVRPGSVLRGELMAEFTAPLTSENFEGVAAFADASGQTHILLVSDDNFSGLQRTLLLSFVVEK